MGGEPIELSRKEFDLLRLLMANAGSVLTRERIIEEVWDTTWFGQTKTLDVHVSSLRKKLGDDPADPSTSTLRGASGSGSPPATRSPAWRAMSLRLRLLAAFAYVLVLVLVALELPLSLNLSRRVDAEVGRRPRARRTSSRRACPTASTTRRSSAESVTQARPTRSAAGSSSSTGAASCLRIPRARLPGRSYASRPEISTVLATGRPTQGERRSDTLDEQLLYTAVPVIHEAQRIGAVRVTQSVEAIGGKVRRDILTLAGIGLVALLLGLVLAWILAGSLSRPLRALARTAERVAGGDLDARAEVDGSTEQREVAQSFNNMTSRLATAVSAQREFVANASHQLRTPLTGLRLRLEAASAKAADPELQQRALRRPSERPSGWRGCFRGC